MRCGLKSVQRKGRECGCNDTCSREDFLGTFYHILVVKIKSYLQCNITNYCLLWSQLQESMITNYLTDSGHKIKNYSEISGCKCVCFSGSSVCYKIYSNRANYGGSWCPWRPMNETQLQLAQVRCQIKEERAHRQTRWPGLHAVFLTALVGSHGLVGRRSAGLGAKGILGQFLVMGTRR